MTRRIHFAHDVEVLRGWIVNSEAHLPLNNIDILHGVLVRLVHGGCYVVEVLQECGVLHPEGSVVFDFEAADLLLQRVSPPIVIVSPGTLVLLLGPWVPDPYQSSCLSIVVDIFDVEQTVGVSRNKSVDTAVVAASASHREVHLGEEFLDCFHF